MLVMRNFGYLGLHCVVNNKSSLAPDRLVDFTGEIQIRRRSEYDEEELSGGQSSSATDTDNVYVVPCDLRRVVTNCRWRRSWAARIS
jgi:hypothetical protein